MIPARASHLALAALLGGMVQAGFALGQTPPAGPVLAARIAAAKAVVEHHAKVQGRLLRCLPLQDQRIGGLAVTDWREQLVRADAGMAEAGIPPADRDAILLPVRVETLTKTGETPAALKASCAASDDWETRWATFRAVTFAPDMREALTGKR